MVAEGKCKIYSGAHGNPTFKPLQAKAIHKHKQKKLEAAFEDLINTGGDE